MPIGVLFRDCRVASFLFESHFATAQIMLRATELGLVALPIAGHRQDAVKEMFAIPEEMTVITLVIVGKPRKS